ncbi:MAG: prolyl oligopeptidase family serine peptidase [Candidatus Neomarinimicrobiota bacterium]
MPCQSKSREKKCPVRESARSILLLTLFLCGTGWAQVPTPGTPPETRKDNVKEIIHGVEVVDPYQWLEDQESPETREWIDEQNAYSKPILDSLPRRDNIQKRLAELMKIDVTGSPQVRNSRYFFIKRMSDQELYVIYIREGLKGEDQVLIDPHGMSPDNTTSVGMRDVSKDGTILAYAIREGGEDEVRIRFLHVDKREHLPDELSKARYWGISITPDNEGFYYTRHEAEGPRVYYHGMGTDPASDTEIFGEGYGPEKILWADLSEDGKHLLIIVWHGSAGLKTEIYYQNVAEKGQIIAVVNDIDARFSGEIGGDRIYLQTNWNAPRDRILAVDINDIPRDPSEWEEIIPMTDAIIEGFSTAGGRLFVNHLENVASYVKVFEPNGRHVRDISFADPGSVGWVSGQWESNEAFYYYSSFHIPPTIYRYDVETGNQEVWAKYDVPLKSNNIEVNQVWYSSKDGTEIPMFLVHRKGLKLDGSNPTLLTGYGGFNTSLTPWFSSTAAIWVENGGVYARPNLRGGGEFGEEWHKAGMLENKQNVFDDFIAAAEWLIEKGYTSPTKLSISGGSNGGLLVGAALTQRPDLFRAVACFYPLLDMVRYHKFLVASFWISEYGSTDDPEQFKYLYAYSPYHRVKSGIEYPAVMFITGDSDTRVDPLHARKMAALLQESTESDNPVLLYYDTKSGHSGGRPLSKQIEDTTRWLSFLFWQLGVKSQVGQ